MSRLLRIPELVDLVLSQLSRRDQARFMRVSRLAFYSAVPFVWNSLHTPSDLFELISGISYKTVPDDGEGGVIELPDPLTELHTSRFKLYAGFVKGVGLFRATNSIHDLPLRARSRTRLESFLNWSPLLDYASKQVLLPKLASLCYRDFDHSVVMNWFRVLLSPSVRTVSFTLPMPDTLPDALALLTSKSPALSRLELFPRGVDRGFGDILFFDRQAPTKRVCDFQALQTLECNLPLLHPQVFPMIGILPHLRSVTIHVEHASSLTSDSKLPNDGFPSLRELCVEDMSPAWATSLWFLKPLLKNLESTSVSVLHKWSESNTITESWADSLLLCLSKNAPGLSSLAILTAGGGPRLLPALLSLDARQAMSQLPLKSLSLDNAHFGDSVGCSFLPSAWPGIEELRCGVQKCTLAELTLFAHGLPHLRELELDVDMSGSCVLRYVTQHLPRSPLYTKFHCLSRNAPNLYKRSDDETMELAKYLCALWPNICCSFVDSNEEDVNSDSGEYAFDEEDAYKQLQHLNVCITRVRAEKVEMS